MAAATVTLEGRFAWAMVDYRWVNLPQNQAEAGRATFICEEKPGGWRIIHVHSRPTAAAGPLSVRAAAFDQVTQLVGGAGADEA